MSKNALAEISIVKEKFGFEVVYSQSDEKIVLLRQELQPQFRPYLHPIRPLDGTFVITENSPAHHPWQHGLYFGLHGVNGSDFWLDSGEKVGSFRETQLEYLHSKNETVEWCVSTHWVHHDGTKLFKEYQNWELVLTDNQFYLDVQFKLIALEHVTIDQCKYGGMFLRMPWRKDVDSKAINSNGEVNNAAEQKMAKWVDITMKWPEHSTPYGFSILESPKNKGFPNFWRVDGNFGIGPSTVIKGETKINKGGELKLAYRLHIHEGYSEQATIEQLFQSFEREIND